MKAQGTAVYIAEDAIARLASDVTCPVLVVADANTYDAAGAAVMAALGANGVRSETLVFRERSGLLPSPEATERVKERLQSRRLPVAVGAGVITDVVRYAAHQRGAAFISVPTAASMDGYASGVAALEVNGVKVTFPARAPRAIYADPAVAAAAPAELTRSGLGDLLGKASARVDWLASHLLYGESYAREAADLVLDPLEFAARQAEAVIAGEREAIRRLLAGLVQSGTAMAMAGSSRPASGSEHHASHFWDLLAARGLRPHQAHGLQVGYATGFTTRLQRLGFGAGTRVPRLPEFPLDPLGGEAREWLGPPSAEIVAAVEEKRRFVAELGHWPRDEEAWSRVRAELAPELERFEQVSHALAAAGIPDEPGYLEIDESMLRAAFRYANRLRARYTVLDFLEGQGQLEEAIGMLFDRAPTSVNARAHGSGGRTRP